MNTWGESLRLSIFGESHGAGIGVTIDGLPPGLDLDFDFIKNEMARRAPGKSEVSTKRSEPDEVEILSGLFEGKTTGTPLCGIIRNTDTNSKAYDKSLLRPGHADYTGLVKYKGFADYRGSGHFSGRLTAPLVFAGAIAKLVLMQRNVTVTSNIKNIYGIKPGTETYQEDMRKAVLLAKDENDSVGGIIECVTNGLPPGLGEPFFDSAESVLSSLLFSIPAVKGVEFGSGFDFAEMRGSQANDSFYVDEEDSECIKTLTNHNGGINGGITNGMPLVFRVVIKPTPSIAKPQQSVNIDVPESSLISVTGRHDPCIVYRALPVVEAAAAISILDLWGRCI